MNGRNECFAKRATYGARSLLHSVKMMQFARDAFVTSEAQLFKWSL